MPLWLVVLAGCSLADPGPTGPTREALLESLATRVFVPAYAELETASATLAAEAEGLCPDPSAKLAGVRSAWLDARVPLKRAEAWAFGPIVDLRIDSAIDFWPVRTDAVEEAIASGEEPTPQWVEAQGTATKGLPVLEYLLFDPTTDEAAIVASLDPATPEGAHRCALGSALASRVAVRAAELHDAWDPAGGDFAGRLRADGDDSPGNPSLRMAVNDVVNHTVFALQNITDMKLGRPLGDKSGGTPQPDAVESRFSDNARVDIIANLEGVEQVYLGGGGLGLADVVGPLDAELDTAIRTQIDASKVAIVGLPDPLRLAVTDDPARVRAAQDVVRELRRLFEVDVAGLLGINITLNDNDGD
ncbi:MAG: imelysin family protein [Deltaproteobacteria bacterium]|nr:imelysin family protein [Deltaproteobacteria bacterium]